VPAVFPPRRIDEVLQAAGEAAEEFAGTHQALIVAACLPDSEQRLSGARQNIARGFLPEQGTVHGVLRNEDNAPQHGFVAHDRDVAFDVGDMRQAIVERDKVRPSVHRLQFVVALQLVRNGDAVDLLAALMQLQHPREDAAVLFELKIGFGDRRHDFHQTGIVQQNRAENKPLRIDVRG
jgi:hypothetical protein